MNLLNMSGKEVVQMIGKMIGLDGVVQATFEDDALVLMDRHGHEWGVSLHAYELYVTDDPLPLYEIGGEG